MGRPLADLLWVGLALLVVLAAVRFHRVSVSMVFACGLTALALLAKEAALSIPALALVACLLDRSRKWWPVLIGSGLAALVYLGARYESLLFAPKAGNLYDWSLANIPMRWLEYQVFPFRLGSLDVFITFLGGVAQPIILFAAALWLLLAIALWQSGWRWLGAFLWGGAAALGPVLVLGQSSAQYGYGFIAFACGLFAAAWPHLPRWGRMTVLACALLIPWHGAEVMRLVRHVGAVQSVFSPALAQAVRSHAAPVRLRARNEDDSWIFLRLTHEIPSYEGIPIGDRVVLVTGDAPADYVIESNGSLTPAR